MSTVSRTTIHSVLDLSPVGGGLDLTVKDFWPCCSNKWRRSTMNIQTISKLLSSSCNEWLLQWTWHMVYVTPIMTRLCIVNKIIRKDGITRTFYIFRSQHSMSWSHRHQIYRLQVYRKKRVSTADLYDHRGSGGVTHKNTHTHMMDLFVKIYICSVMDMRITS